MARPWQNNLKYEIFSELNELKLRVDPKWEGDLRTPLCFTPSHHQSLRN